MDNTRDSSGRLGDLSRDPRNRCGEPLTPAAGVPFAGSLQHPRPGTSERVATSSSRPDGGVAVTLAAGQASASRLRPSGSLAERPTPTLRS